MFLNKFILLLFLYFIKCCYSQVISNKVILVSKDIQYLSEEAVCLFSVNHYITFSSNAPTLTASFESTIITSKNLITTSDPKVILVSYSFGVSTSSITSDSIKYSIDTTPTETKYSYNYSCQFPVIKNSSDIDKSSLMVYSNGQIKGIFKLRDFSSLTILPSLVIDTTKSSSPCDVEGNCIVTNEYNMYIVYIIGYRIINFSDPLNIYFSLYDSTFNVTFNGLEISNSKVNFFKTNSIVNYPTGSNIILNSVNNFYQYSFINITSDSPIDYLFGTDGITYLKTATLISNTENKLTSLFLCSATSNRRLFNKIWDNDKLLKNVTTPGPTFPYTTISSISFEINEKILSYSKVQQTDTGNKLIIRNYFISGLTGSAISSRVSLTLGGVVPKINSFIFSSPYGVLSYSQKTPLSNLINFQLLHSLFIKQITPLTINIQGYTVTPTPTDAPIYDSTNDPLLDLQFSYLGLDNWLIKLVYKADSVDSGFMKLSGFTSTLLKKSDLVSADPSTSIFTYSTIFKNQVNIFTNEESTNPYALLRNSGYIKYYQFSDFINVPKFPVNENFEILELYFKTPAMNLTSTGGYNSVYLRIKLDNKDNLFFLQPFFALTPKLNSNIHFNKYLPFSYVDDSVLKLDFYVPANLPSGEIDYSIATPFSQTSILNSDYIKFKLNYNSTANLRSYSKESDSMPPLVKSVRVTKSELIYDLNSIQIAEWEIVIEEGLNGFDWGFITISSSTADYAKYQKNITFTQLDNQNQILIQVPIECSIYNLEISNLTLVDKQGFISRYSKYYLESNPDVLDPFMKVVSNIPIPTVQVSCGLVPNTDPAPVFNIVADCGNQVDVFSLTNISFKVTYSHIDQVSINQLPVLYLTGGLEETPIQVSLVPDTIESGDQNFIGSTVLPYGFAYPYPIIMSVFGLSTKSGVWTGYGAEYSYKITTTYPSTNILPPLMLSTSNFYSTGVLVIYGNNLGLPTVIVSQRALGESTYSSAYFTTDGSAIFIDIKGRIENEFSIRLLEGLPNNILTVKPIVSYVNEANENQLSPPLPTNAPQKCLGSPICGGPKQGYCSDKGCICYSPWIGESCQSKVITIPPPTSNPNEPSSNLTTINDDYTLINIVSLVSLRELDLNGKEFKVYQFKKWNQTQINKNTNQYITNVKENYDDENSPVICTVIVETIWFEELSNITFANQQLVMNPSTLKYNINITSYPFESSLNTLQLIMSASSQANNEDSSLCSGQEFGETVSDNSNFVNIKIGDHSLYSRFIKRGIVDSRFTSLSNEILTELSHETFYKSETYIAISIPNYEFLVALDPDFSIILNPNSANSVCGKSKGISKGALIGVIVGCVGGAILITISILLIVKYKYHLKNIKNNIKLKKINS